LETRPTKNVATKRPNTHKKNELRRKEEEEEEEEEEEMLTHAYQRGEFMFNEKLDLCPIREKRKRVKNVKIFSG